jgi:hypothetical protein
VSWFLHAALFAILVASGFDSDGHLVAAGIVGLLGIVRIFA